MFKKSRVIMIAAGVFCAGVLLGGIGTGVAIAEYTNLEYSGQHILGEENMKTENLDVTVTPKDGHKLLVRQNYYRGNGEQYDDSIPMNTVRYVVRYNTELVSIRARYEEYDMEEGEAGISDEMAGEEDTEPEDTTGSGDRDSDDTMPVLQGEVYMDWNYIGDEFDLIMRNKDKILSDLKQGKVGSYQTRAIESIEVWMNPGMKPFVDISW